MWDPDAFSPYVWFASESLSGSCSYPNGTRQSSQRCAEVSVWAWRQLFLCGSWPNLGCSLENPNQKQFFLLGSITFLSSDNLWLASPLLNFDIWPATPVLDNTHTYDTVGFEAFSVSATVCRAKTLQATFETRGTAFLFYDTKSVKIWARVR